MPIFARTLALALLLAGASQTPDAARVLADMRQALGGDAAIAAVQGFSVSGSESHTISGRSSVAHLELVCALPDRFLRVRRLDSPFGVNKDEYGFNGNERIRRRRSDLPYPPDPGQNDTPAQRSQREARALANAKREFARMAIAMIGLSSVDPVDVSYAGQRTIDRKPAHALVLRAADGYEATVFVDATTHLPLMISWMGTPIVTASSSSFVTVPRGGTPGRAPVPSFPAMPDPLSLPPVEHELYFGDYKTVDDLTWPHKFVEMVGSFEYATIKLGKFKLNPKIDPKRFDPRVR